MEFIKIRVIDQHFVTKMIGIMKRGRLMKVVDHHLSMCNC